MAFKLNTLNTYDSVKIKLIDYPEAFKAKCEEFVEEGIATDIADAERQLKDCEIDLQLVYHKHYGLFGVEAEAIESCASDIVSPYSGENAESIIEEE